jgi:hypothetical protein
MTDAQLYAIWGWSLGAAAVVVLLAAALLIAILLVARSILAHAGQALDALHEIDESTRVIWDLEETNRIAGEILETAESIEERGAGISGALQGEHASSGGGAK